MTQGKAPEWATEQAAALMPEGAPYALTWTVGLALSQAYERGQESMRERAASVTETRSHDDDSLDYQVRVQAATAIRSLPIEQEGGE